MARKIVKVFAGILLLALMLNFEGQAQVVDYLQVPGPVKFHKSDFYLAWSSHPTAEYYKQEYVQKGEKVESYKEMILLEFLAGKKTPQDLLSQKVQDLEARKKTDPVVNYGVMKSPDGKEFILDFIISSGPAGNLEIAEWNAYRYKAVKDAAGKEGVILAGISRRAYGNEINGFLKELNTTRPDYRGELIKYSIPEIKTGK